MEGVARLVAALRERIHPTLFNNIIPQLVDTAITLAAAAGVELGDECTCALLDLKSCCEKADGPNGSMSSEKLLMERERLISAPVWIRSNQFDQM